MSTSKNSQAKTQKEQTIAQAIANLDKGKARVKGATQAQLDAINDMSSGGGAIGENTVVSLGADMVRDRKHYPEQVKKTLRYAVIALQAGDPITPSNLNKVAVDYMKKTPLAARDPKLAWAQSNGEPYAQDVVEIFKHYGSMMIGDSVWKSKNLTKSECYVIG